MILFKKPALLAAILATTAFVSLAPALAQQAPAADKTTDSSGDSASDLAKKLQNPIGDLYSFPFQGNTNFGVGPHSGTQEILNVQPVIPFHVSDDWNIITRTILPLVWNPDMSPLPSTAFGTAPTTFSAFLSPRNPTNGWLWGVGPVVQIPTATSPTLGSSVWGGGATGVLVYMNGPWVAGVLVNNVWSLGGKDGLFATRYNNFLTQPFVNYNFGAGWYLTSSPIVTANWEAPGTKWTLPIGGGAGRVVKIGKLPVNFMVGAYYNLVRPEYGADWQLRTQVTLIF
ncbi:transporter [Telmatospirillum sp.]|uniref:transporter n=1 Tax=Telmatospirillum sp. TaxID=2079197 RepID=UPI00284F03D3|nr:transporter [Telmatospirillum sp.]MDR3435321.1 transporter [Telmatospirillum sp.]